MSSYWSAAHGAALILTEDELKTFIQTYNRIQNDNIDVDDEYFLFDDLGSLNASNNDKNLRFEISHIDPDQCSGMFFVPFVRSDDGSANLVKLHRLTDAEKQTSKNEEIVFDMDRNEFIIDKDQIIITWSDENRYAIYSKHNMYGPAAFPPPYNTYDELKNEFQQRLHAYLPEDFDWDSHIGALSYAYYA